MFNKLTKRNTDFTIESISNGFILQVGGRSDDGDWITEKVHVPSIDELLMSVRDVVSMPVDE
jgi:hypothetical protein